MLKEKLTRADHQATGLSGVGRELTPGINQNSAITELRAVEDADYVARAWDLREVIEREAAGTESGGTLSAAVVGAMRENGLFWISVPRALGGGGKGIVEAMSAVEAVAFADGSTGWSLMANQGATVTAAAYLGDQAIEAMFGDGNLPIVAGMFGPAGKSRQIEGGYQAAGKFAFGSGCAHAGWIGSGMFVMDENRPRMLPGGIPEVRVCFVPRNNVEFLGNWNPPGLVGTGSYDYAVPDQFVSQDFTFERTTIEPKRGGPLFTLGLAAIGASGHAGVVIGLMRRALTEIVEITSGKKRPGYPGPVGEHDVFKHQFTLHEAAYQAARNYAYRVFTEAETRALEGTALTPEQRERIRQATTWLHQVAGEVVRFCHLWAGSEIVKKDSPISRLSRDMAVATQHVVVDPITLVAGAPAIMDSWRKSDKGTPNRTVG
jgi:alkylation response protein AidB-like acyl-CoA dehydrogenase